MPPTPPPAPPSPQDDPETIKNLMLLWLTIVTQPAENGTPFLQMLAGNSAAAVRARQALGAKLRVDPAVVKIFVSNATTDPSIYAQVQTVQNLFHNSVVASGEPYEGPFCPRKADRIYELLPAQPANVPAPARRPKAVTAAILRADARARKSGMVGAPAKKAAKKKAVKKAAAKR